MKEIVIKLGDLKLKAYLNNSDTAKKIWEILPIETSFNTWGDEIYFTVPVHVPLDENARDEVEIGDLGYWPQGPAFCIFFGKTPVSKEDKIIPASAVNLIGKIMGDATLLKGKIKESTIRIEKA